MVLSMVLKFKPSQLHKFDTTEAPVTSYLFLPDNIGTIYFDKCYSYKWAGSLWRIHDHGRTWVKQSIKCNFLFSV